MFWVWKMRGNVCRLTPNIHFISAENTIDSAIVTMMTEMIGSPIIGNQALESIAAAVLGGASLAGGRGSYLGTMLAALFLTEVNNILPLFQQPAEYADMTIGRLILVALVLYQTPELVARIRSSRQRLDGVTETQA